MQTSVNKMVQTPQQAFEFSSWQKNNEIKLRGHLPGMFATAGHDYYCLRVSGDSMMGEESSARDLILVKRTEYAKDEDIIISVVDGQVKLKKFRKFDDHIELHSANSQEEMIIVTEANDFRVAGIVEGHFRL